MTWPENCWSPWTRNGVVVTADAAHTQRETAEYIAGRGEDGGRDADYFLFVKGSQPGVQRAVFDLIQAAARKPPDHVEPDNGHGRVIKRPLWVTGAGDPDFPQVTRVARIRRDRHDIIGALISGDYPHPPGHQGRDQGGVKGGLVVNRVEGHPQLPDTRANPGHSHMRSSFSALLWAIFSRSC